MTLPDPSNSGRESEDAGERVATEQRRLTVWFCERTGDAMDVSTASDSEFDETLCPCGGALVNGGEYVSVVPASPALEGDDSDLQRAMNAAQEATRLGERLLNALTRISEILPPLGEAPSQGDVVRVRAVIAGLDSARAALTPAEPGAEKPELTKWERKQLEAMDARDQARTYTEDLADLLCAAPNVKVEFRRFEHSDWERGEIVPPGALKAPDGSGWTTVAPELPDHPSAPTTLTVPVDVNRIRAARDSGTAGSEE